MLIDVQAQQHNCLLQSQHKDTDSIQKQYRYIKTYTEQNKKNMSGKSNISVGRKP
jgi:hypothetical protein